MCKMPGTWRWKQTSDGELNDIFAPTNTHTPTHVLFKKIFYCCSVTVVCIFSPSLHPPAKPTSFPHLHPPPWFGPCLIYSSSWKPFSPLFPPHSPLAIIRLFLTSVSLVIFCLLFSSVDYVPVKGEIIWYLSLTAWLISLGMKLTHVLLMRIPQRKKEKCFFKKSCMLCSLYSKWICATVYTCIIIY